MTMPDWSNWESQKLAVEAEYRQRMNFVEWMKIGVNNKWISEPFCDTHDAGYLTEEEEKEWEEGNDPCMPVFRIWEENIEIDESQYTIDFEEE